MLLTKHRPREVSAGRMMKHTCTSSKHIIHPLLQIVSSCSEPHKHGTVSLHSLAPKGSCLLGKGGIPDSNSPRLSRIKIPSTPQLLFAEARLTYRPCSSFCCRWAGRWDPPGFPHDLSHFFRDQVSAPLNSSSANTGYWCIEKEKEQNKTIEFVSAFFLYYITWLLQNFNYNKFQKMHTRNNSSV